MCVPAPHADLLLGEESLVIVAVGLVPPGERAEVTIGDQGRFEPQFTVPLESTSVMSTAPSGATTRTASSLRPSSGRPSTM
ncbi:hypothetical protein [Streptomyces abikoensis]|uniref:hypothetical protein n=1 Tax=Streptomyces abikoensis TaxID=97398 RepID=UPI00367BEA56